MPAPPGPHTPPDPRPGGAPGATSASATPGGSATPGASAASAAPGGSGGEDAAVALIAARFGAACGAPPAGEVWIGDDAAVVAGRAGQLVLATDAAVAGIHADLALVGLDDLGWKALTATVSDVGAVGGRPAHALVTFCIPPGTDLALLTDGVAEAARHWGCAVVGGDVTAASQVVVSVAATGTLAGTAPPVLRSGARAGDRLFVTGPLGASAAGLRILRARHAAARHGGAPGTDARGPGAAAGATSRSASGRGADPGAHRGGADDVLVTAHRRPLARIEEGVAARAAGASAMADISDGLAIDLHRLADASGVGLSLDAIPVAPGATETDALGGGEDYELVIATPDPDALRAAFAEAGLRPPVEIGRCTADAARRELAGAPLARVGFEHRIA